MPPAPCMVSAAAAACAVLLPLLLLLLLLLREPTRRRERSHIEGEAVLHVETLNPKQKMSYLR